MSQSGGAKLKITAGAGRFDVHVELDGHDLTNCLTGLTLTMKPGDIARVTLDVRPGAVEVDADAVAALARFREPTPIQAEGGER